MKTVTITEFRRELAPLIEAGQPVEVTRRGAAVGIVRIQAEPKFDPERAAQAARRIRELAAKCKPNPRAGATRLIRKLRDDGE